MRKGTVAIATIATIATSAALVTSAAFAHPTAEGTGNVSAQTAVKGNFMLGSHGTSTSFAHNSETAKASITASKSYAPNQSHAVVQGATKTDSAGTAYNASTGSGSGIAMSSGGASTSTKGTVGQPGVTRGFNGGGSGTQTSNMIKAATNQGSAISGQTLSGFEALIQSKSGTAGAPHAARTNAPHTAPAAGQRSASIEVTGVSEGYASGANSTAALTNLNAAGIANIQSSGYFFGKTNLSGSTGQVVAP